MSEKGKKMGTLGIFQPPEDVVAGVDDWWLWRCAVALLPKEKEGFREKIKGKAFL